MHIALPAKAVRTATVLVPHLGLLPATFHFVNNAGSMLKALLIQPHQSGPHPRRIGFIPCNRQIHAIPGTVHRSKRLQCEFGESPIRHQRLNAQRAFDQPGRTVATQDRQIRKRQFLALGDMPHPAGVSVFTVSAAMTIT